MVRPLSQSIKNSKKKRLFAKNAEVYSIKRIIQRIVLDLIKNEEKNLGIITSLALFLWTYGCSYCAPHDVGIAKLAIYGFDEKTYCYIYSYLKSKQQCANLNNIKSTFEEAISGDLRGSVIGPFDIFFNYFFYFTLVTSSLNFADDNIP